jgi:hypothetical protein
MCQASRAGTRLAYIPAVNRLEGSAMRLVKSMMFMMIATGVVGIALTFAALGA